MQRFHDSELKKVKMLQMLLSHPCSSLLVNPELLAQPGLRQPEVRAQVHQEQRLPQLLRVPRRRLRAHRKVQVQQRLRGRRDMHHQRPGLRSAGVQGNIYYTIHTFSTRPFYTLFLVMLSC